MLSSAAHVSGRLAELNGLPGRWRGRREASP